MTTRREAAIASLHWKECPGSELPAVPIRTVGSRRQWWGCSVCGPGIARWSTSSDLVEPAHWHMVPRRPEQLPVVPTQLGLFV